jgi:hypothetical protein
MVRKSCAGVGWRRRTAALDAYVPLSARGVNLFRLALPARTRRGEVCALARAARGGTASLRFAWTLSGRFAFYMYPGAGRIIHAAHPAVSGGLTLGYLGYLGTQYQLTLDMPPVAG